MFFLVYFYLFCACGVYCTDNEQCCHVCPCLLKAGGEGRVCAPGCASADPWRRGKVRAALSCVQVQASCPLMLTENSLAGIVKIFLIMYKYTFSVFRRRAGAFRPPIICLYARQVVGGGENGNFRATRKPSFLCSRWSLES